MNIWTIGLTGLASMVLFVLYYVLLIRLVLLLLRHKANPVLLVFSFLSLCPMPPCLVIGVFVLIIGSIHARALKQTPWPKVGQTQEGGVPASG